MAKQQLLMAETKQSRKTFGTRKNKDQMRLVALQSGELRYINDSFARTLNLTADDLIGRNMVIKTPNGFTT